MSPVLEPTALFAALGKADVHYVLIGGFAVAAHGAIRATADLDICPDPAEANLRRLANLLGSIEAHIADGGDFEPAELAAPDFEALRAGGNFRLRTTLGALDVMQYLEPFAANIWPALDKHAEERQVFGEKIRVCGYDDLIKMKSAAGRDQDRIDIANIKAARRELN